MACNDKAHYRMISTVVGILLTILVPAPSLASSQLTASDVARAFSDVSGDEWFSREGALSYAVSRGLLTGYGDGTFGPYDAVTRGQAVSVLWRISGRPALQTQRFNDVDYDQYYGGAVHWARATGIVSGYDGSNRFGPNDPVTREQLAKMIFSYAARLGVDVSVEGDEVQFVDDSLISAWARPSVAWCAQRGVITGDAAEGGPRANPQGTAQRCQLAKMVSVLHRGVIVPHLGYEPEPVYATDDTVVLVGTIQGMRWQHPTLGWEPFYVLQLDRPATFVMTDSFGGINRYEHVVDLQIWDNVPEYAGRRAIVESTVFEEVLTHWGRRHVIVWQSRVTPLSQ